MWAEVSISHVSELSKYPNIPPTIKKFITDLSRTFLFKQREKPVLDSLQDLMNIYCMGIDSIQDINRLGVVTHATKDGQLQVTIKHMPIITGYNVLGFVTLAGICYGAWQFYHSSDSNLQDPE
ncbi:hypothetical protein TREMEDRAFT_64894 [Tremella mesenterica DSM 1558]|uniref:uncharacterized protein n=1 Tax=Tremella mesenterica (strain ATCC 24925 / CBS 8224 / DSM 1558 / NBRC 9311 / NRRL Y-6157 / RJB 2259-6 / UBC 559-6) TaxID=578456 RepID=UPI0003F4A1CA|nr:uncharacterized protein TREMEDRAFT_64894 [Tremella mesenterica DSM 1558]EIW67027.1 hypothetical protein TREMEDRAFT_64894 [Tremella mesenterica DSM 1558]